MIISVGTESWQGPTPMHDKISQKRGIEGNLCNLIKGIYEKPEAKIILNGEMWMLFPWDWELGKNFCSYHFFSTFTQGSS